MGLKLTTIEYTKQLDELITSKVKLRNDANKEYNAHWKHMNSFRQLKKLLKQKELQLMALVSKFKNIDFVDKIEDKNNKEK